MMKTQSLRKTSKFSKPNFLQDSKGKCRITKMLLREKKTKSKFRTSHKLRKFNSCVRSLNRKTKRLKKEKQLKMRISTLDVRTTNCKKKKLKTKE